MNIQKSLCVPFVIFLVSAAVVHAEDPVSCAASGECAKISNSPESVELPQTVVTADRVAVPLEDAARSIEVRDETELQQREVRNLTEAVQDVSGLRMVEIGGPGAPGVAPLEIRGFPVRGTQLLLNGMKLNDPSSISGTYESFLSFLGLNGISQVEVLKGGSAVLYGSDSQGGAVNLISTAPEPGVSGQAAFEGGTYDTYTESALFNGGTDRGGFVGSVARTDSNGLDAHGDYGNTTASALGSYDVVPETLTVSPIFRMVDAEVALDQAPGVDEAGNLVPNQDTPRDHVSGRSSLFGTTVKHQSPSDIESEVKIYAVDNSRRYLFDFSGFESRSRFEGTSLNLDGQSTFDLSRLQSKITGGWALEHQNYQTESDDLDADEQRDQLAAFVHSRTHFFDDALLLSGGARVAHISDIDKTVPAFEAASLYKVPVVFAELHASLAQGFRAPTLFETKGTMVDFMTGNVVTVGNTGLDPERALTFDAGLRQKLFDDGISLDVTYFQTRADDAIFFDYAAMTHRNGDDGDFRGIETSLLFRATDWLSLRGAYTNVDQADRGDGLRRPRSPRHWFAWSAVAEVEQLTFAAQVRYRASQELEFFGVEERVTEDAAAVCDMSAAYRFSDNLSLFVRAGNVFDADYTEAGYHMPRASIYGGIRISADDQG